MVYTLAEHAYGTVCVVCCVLSVHVMCVCTECEIAVHCAAS